MSQSHQPHVTIGCPSCDASISTPVPGGPGIQTDGGTSDRSSDHRLSGRISSCDNCGHTFELYYY